MGDFAALIASRASRAIAGSQVLGGRVRSRLSHRMRSRASGCAVPIVSTGRRGTTCSSAPQGEQDSARLLTRAPDCGPLLLCLQWG